MPTLVWLVKIYFYLEQKAYHIISQIAQVKSFFPLTTTLKLLFGLVVFIKGHIGINTVLTNTIKQHKLEQ